MKATTRERLRGWSTRAFLLPVHFYRRCISVWTPATCRYHPTCSEYAVVAVTRFGVFKGSWLSIRRIARCHPFAGYGEDPVPERTAQRNFES